jgi:hypothetical protein
MSKPNTAFLRERFPLMYDEDDQNLGQWCPLPADLPLFLRQVFPKSLAARELVLELYQHLPFGGGTLVSVSDATIARRTGIEKRNVQRTRESAEFRRWVTVCPGEPRRKGEKLQAGVYDLRRLMLRYNSFHYRGEVSEEPVVLLACGACLACKNEAPDLCRQRRAA